MGAVLLPLLTVPSDAASQPATAPKSDAPRPASSKPTPSPAAPATSAPAPLSVSVEQVFYLTRSTLLTLNDANRSGNYSVLRDLAAPGFQAHNTAADLAVNFTDLRRRNFDLFAAALIPPQLIAAPTVDAEGKLHLSGLFPTRPLQIRFDLIFEVVAGQWKLFGIAIATPEAPPLEAQTSVPSSEQKPSKAPPR